MLKEEKIREIRNWYYSELNGVETGSIQYENQTATRKYYLGAINALNWVLEEKGEIHN